MTFDRHADPIDLETPLDADFRKAQNVRRFLRAECGPAFRFDRPFIAWIDAGEAKTMGDVADEWRRRNPPTS